MENQKHSRSCSQPFSLCSHLCVLLATAAHVQCNECEPDIAYYSVPQSRSFVRKQRKAHNRELKASRQSTRKPQLFQITTDSRTPKHKQSAFRAKQFITDSGANITCIKDPNLFLSVDEVNPRKYVQVASKQQVRVTAIGTIRLTMYDKLGAQYTVLHSNVHYAPEFSSNLLSVDEMWQQHRCATIFRGKQAYFITPDNVTIPIERDNHRRFMLHADSASESQGAPSDPWIWHRRFMHAGNPTMQRMACVIKALRKPFDFSKCDACLQGGGRKLPFNRSSKRAAARSTKLHRSRRFKYFGERISCDLCGPFPKGINGEKYAIVFHDSCTGFIETFALRDKQAETVADALQRFMAKYETQLSRGITKFYTDNGSEFLNSQMEQLCNELCIVQGYSIPYAPEQNPYAERTWGSLLRAIRSTLADSKTDERFWPYTMQQATLLHNVVVDDNCISAYEKVHGEQFDYNRLHTMCCLCYYLLPERDRLSKLSPRALPATYLGEDNDRAGHIVYVHGLGRLTSAYHVVFNEHRFYSAVLDRHSRGAFDPEPPVDPSSVRRRHHREERDDADPPDADDGESMQDQLNDRHEYERQVPLNRNLPPSGDPRHGTDAEWNENHCENSRCTYSRGHDGPHSYEDIPERLRSQSREERGRLRNLYTQCATEGCKCYDDHCGDCTDENGEPIKTEVSFASSAVTFHDDFNRSTSSDRTSEDVVYFVEDDVIHQVLQVDLAQMGDVPCPKKYRDTQSSPLRKEWNESMRKEYQALLDNQTWEYVSRFDPRLKRRKPTKSRWVYTIKYNRDGTVERYKSRFVVCGYSQRQGIDYDRAFSATLRSSSFRMLLSIAAGRHLKLTQFDVKNAFTQANMDDVDLFVEPPEGKEFQEFETVNGKQYSKLLYLKRALYGTKQASRLWQEELRKFLTGLHFIQSKADPCVYRLQRDNQEIILGVYVDDIITAHSGDKLFEEFKASFNLRFPGSQGGKPLHWFLGMAIDQHADFSIDVNHEQSIDKLAQKYIPQNKVTREYPLADAFQKLDKAQTSIDRAKVQNFPYASLVGALLYIAVMSRPDIAFYTSVLAKFLSDPSPEACDAAIILLQYLHSTRSRKMHFSGQVRVPAGLDKHGSDITRNHGFIAYSDSSWGNAVPYPMFGYAIYLHGSLISYASKQLKTVAFSSAEAEYAAASFTCKEIEFLRNLANDMGVRLNGRLVIAVDNTAAIDIAFNNGVSGRTKHYNMAIHYFRDLTNYRRILPAWVDTRFQRADGYTKALDKSKFLQWVQTCLRK